MGRQSYGDVVNVAHVRWSVVCAAFGVLSLAAPAASSVDQPGRTTELPPACAGVWQEVLPTADTKWNTVILPPRAEDERLPTPEALRMFLDAVPGLRDGASRLDAVDRDILYVRLQTKPLDELGRHYPSLNPDLLEKAKVGHAGNACWSSRSLFSPDNCSARSVRLRSHACRTSVKKGCPPLDVSALATGCERARLLAAGDDFFFLCWDGRAFQMRYAGDVMASGPRAVQAVRPAKAGLYLGGRKRSLTRPYAR